MSLEGFSIRSCCKSTPLAGSVPISPSSPIFLEPSTSPSPGAALPPPEGERPTPQVCPGQAKIKGKDKQQLRRAGNLPATSQLQGEEQGRAGRTVWLSDSSGGHETPSHKAEAAAPVCSSGGGRTCDTSRMSMQELVRGSPWSGRKTRLSAQATTARNGCGDGVGHGCLGITGVSQGDREDRIQGWVAQGLLMWLLS